MSTKLTLNIQDKDLIKAAKDFATTQNKSLSVMVENILRTLVQNPKRDFKEVKSPISKSLLGAFSRSSKETIDDAKWEYLKDKYEL